MNAEILKTMYQKDLQAFDEVLTRRALQYDRVLSKDVFGMNEQDQAKHAALCKKLGEEILAMDRMRQIVGEMIAIGLSGPATKVETPTREYDNLLKNHLTLLQSHNALVQESSFFIDLHVNPRQYLRQG